MMQAGNLSSVEPIGDNEMAINEDIENEMMELDGEDPGPCSCCSKVCFRFLVTQHTRSNFQFTDLW